MINDHVISSFGRRTTKGNLARSASCCLATLDIATSCEGSENVLVGRQARGWIGGSDHDLNRLATYLGGLHGEVELTFLRGRRDGVSKHGGVARRKRVGLTIDNLRDRQDGSVSGGGQEQRGESDEKRGPHPVVLAIEQSELGGRSD